MTETNTRVVETDDPDAPQFTLSATIKTDDHPDGAVVRVVVYGPDLLTAVRGLVKVGDLDTAARVLGGFIRQAGEDVDDIDGGVER